MGFGYWGFFAPPAGLAGPVLVAWLLFTSFVVRTATSAYSIPYYAVGVALARDYHERTSITAYRGLIGALGTLLTASLSFMLFFRERVPGVDPKLHPSGYAEMGMWFGLVMSLAGLLSLWGIRRLGIATGRTEAVAEQGPTAFFDMMWSYLQYSSCRTALLSSALVTIGLATNSAMLLHFLKHYAKIDGSVALSTAQASFFCAGILGIVVWSRFAARRFDKHRLFTCSTAITAAVMASGYLFFGEGKLVGTGNAGPLFVMYGLAGFFNCILWFIPQSMLADIADGAELLTGSRREGALFGLNSLTQQIATGIGILTAGVLLDGYVGLIPGNAQQSASTVTRIAIVYSVVPACLFVVAAILIHAYQLTGERLKEIQTQIEATRKTRGPAFDY